MDLQGGHTVIGIIMPHKPKYAEFRSILKKDYYWHVCDMSNGRILADSSQGYSRRIDMRNARVSVVTAIVDAMSPEELELVRIHLDGIEVDASIDEDLG
jgi:hypothetical protein